MQDFSPKAFLKKRRPERYSDSSSSVVRELDRSLLEYHLDTLTNRSQEAVFETFARKLCEREICPNLLPTTGPTGGGDSKADAETFPVAEQLSLVWLDGYSEGAARERWAFAFSAKKKWQPKVEADVKKIVDTGRGYTKAFFVTNQFVKASFRSKLEDELRSNLGIEVRIFDRTWILDRVFSQGHQDLAIEVLGVTALTKEQEKVGPQDFNHREDLAELEVRLNEAVQNGQFDTVLVDDALEAADRIRSLELPEMRVEAAYERADRLAIRCGTERQLVEVAYQWAYTRFYWLENFDGFVSQYGIVEERVLNSRNIRDFERLYTLWMCLFSGARRNLFAIQDSLLELQTLFLLAELHRMASDEDRPSTALGAETMTIEINLMQARYAEMPVGKHLLALNDVINRSEGLVGYPLRTLIDSLPEIGIAFEGVKEYEVLFETVLSISAKRDGDLAAARLLLSRGKQLLNLERPIQAIAVLGRSLTKLYKEESQHELISALYSCGWAYDAAGLSWAARGSILAAASIAADRYWKYNEVTIQQFLTTDKLKWIELKLGRLPQLFAWHETSAGFASVLRRSGVDQKDFGDHESQFENLLAGLMMRVDFNKLDDFNCMPDLFDRLGLDLAGDALLFKLGYEERLTELAKHFEVTSQVWASRWFHYYQRGVVAEHPQIGEGRYIEYQSRVLGCEINLVCENTPQCIAVSESILAAIEATLATAELHRIYAREANLTIRVVEQSLAMFPLKVEISEKIGIPHLDVVCSSFDPHNMSVENQNVLIKALSEVNSIAIANIVTASDFQQSFQALFGDERALERAENFTRTFGFQANVLGFKPRITWKDWVLPEFTEYPVIRNVNWTPDDDEKNSFKNVENNSKASVEPDSSSERSHDEMKVEPLIRIALWDRAKWSGAGFSFVENTTPYLCLIFEDRKAANQIFKGWRQILGDTDRGVKLRIVIILGVDKNSPNAYRILITTNPDRDSLEHKYFMIISRCQEMNPASLYNLNGFINAFQISKTFYLMPAFIITALDESQSIDFNADVAIMMESLVIREAWQIGPHDLESAAIHDDDDVIIPTTEHDPPILQLFVQRRERLETGSRH